jgi:hypothetical protein
VNRERHKFWAAYIHDVQGRMLLGNWDIDLRREPTRNDNAEATVMFRGCAHEARLFLSGEFDGNTRAEQRHTLVHELLHLHPLLGHLDMQFGGREDWPALHDAHVSHEEFVVEDLARIIAPSMPLPPKVKP